MKRWANIAVIVFVFLSATSSFAAKEGWALTSGQSGQYSVLYVSRPGSEQQVEIVRSPHRIMSSAISADGKLVAYLTDEKGFGGLQVIVQVVRTGMRVKKIAALDPTGILKFENHSLRYQSPQDDISADLSELAK